MRCAACFKSITDELHSYILAQRCKLDDETFRAVNKHLDLSSSACGPDERDSSGNPVVCASCLRKAIDAVKTTTKKRSHP
jgi:hypothetical protein